MIARKDTPSHIHQPPQGDSTTTFSGAALLRVERSTIISLGVDGDLHTSIMRRTRGIKGTFLVNNTALVVVLAIDPVALFALEGNGVRARCGLLEGQDLVGDDVATAAGGDDVGRAT